MDAPARVTVSEMQALAQGECRNYLTTSLREGCSFGWMHAEPVVYRILPPSLRGETHHMVNSVSVPILNDGEVPVYDMLIDTIFRSSMVPSPKKFGDFNTQTPEGMNTAARVCLFSKALSNPRYGSSSEVSGEDVHINTERASYMCMVNGAHHPKVTVVYEVLLKQRVSDSENLVPDTDDENRNLNKLLSSDAWIGYRAWYLVHDQHLSTLSCIEQHMNSTRSRLGLTLPIMPMPISGSAAHDIIENEYAGEREKYLRVAETHNRNAARANSEQEKLRELTKDRQTKEVHDYDILVTNPLEMYNVVFTGVNGPYEQIVGGSTDGAMLRVADSLWEDTISHLLNFRSTFSILNTTTSSRLRSLGLCPTQLSYSNYIQCSGREGDLTKKLEFPIPEFAYKATAIQARSEHLFATPITWNFYAIDLLLEQYMRVFAARREAEHDIADRAYLDSYKDECSYEDGVTREFIQNMTTLSREELRRCGRAGDVPIDVTANPWHAYSTGSVDSSHFAYTQLARVRTAEQIEAEISEVICIDSALENPKRLYMERFAKLRLIWHTLDLSVQHMLTRMLRQAGMREFDAAFQHRHMENTNVVRASAKTLRELETTGTTAHLERVCMIPKHGLWQSMVARSLFEAHTVYGMQDPALFRGISMDVLRAAADPDIDKMHEMCTDIAHQKIYGPPGTGKSKMQETMVQTKVRGTFRVVSSGSTRSQNTPRDNSDGVIVHDEITGAIAMTKDSTPQEKQQQQNSKEMMTSFGVTHVVLTTCESTASNPLTGRETILGRRSFSTRSRCHSMIYASGNDGGDPRSGAALNSRFSSNMWTSSVHGAGLSMDVTPLTLSVGSSSLSGLMDTRLDTTNKWYAQREHPICVAVFKMMATGALQAPNIDTFVIHWSAVYRMLVRHMPSISTKNRVSGRMLSRAQAETVSYATSIVFGSEISPLVQRDYATGKVYCVPFNIDQVALVRPYLFLPEDAAIHIITEFVSRYYLPSQVYLAARSIANRYCNYYTREQQRAGLGVECAKPSYKLEAAITGVGDMRAGSVTMENRGYVSANVTRGELIEFLKREHGHNRSTADDVLIELEQMQVLAPVHKMTPSDFSEGAKRIAQTIIPVLTLCTSMSQVTRQETTEICLSTYYLETFLPEDILRRVLKTICYNGIRKRKVLIGIPRENNRSMWICETVKPGAHPLVVKNNKHVSAQARRIFYGAQALTRTQRDAACAMSSGSVAKTIVYDKQDMEEAICKKWLVEDLGYSAIEAALYTPNQLNHRVDMLHEANTVYSSRSLKTYEEIATTQKSPSSSMTPTSYDRTLDLFWDHACYAKAFSPKLVQHTGGVAFKLPAAQDFSSLTLPPPSATFSPAHNHFPTATAHNKRRGVIPAQKDTFRQKKARQFPTSNLAFTS